MSLQTGAAVAEDDAVALLEAAYRDLQQGALDRAEGTYRGLLDNPDHRADALNGLGLAAMLRGQMDTAIRVFRDVLKSDPGHGEARLNLVKAFLVEGRRLTGEGRLESAFSGLESARKEIVRDGPGNVAAMCRVPLAGFLGQLAKAYQIRRSDFSRSIDLLRLARSLNPENADLRIELDIVLQGTGAPGRLGDYTDQINESELGKHLLIACFPKSGSTFLKEVLVQATGFPEQHLAFANGQNDTGLYLPDMLNSARDDNVTQIHLRATNSNLNMLQGFSIRPVILVRNIYDVLLSFKEFHDQISNQISFFDRYDSLDEDQRLDLIVDDRASWYIGFFAGWQRAVRAGQIDALWLTYENLMENKVDKVSEVLRFYGVERSREAISGVIDQVNGNKAATRFNKGVSGRGRAQFSDAHRAQISRIAGYHPDTDFSMIGL